MGDSRAKGKAGRERVRSTGVSGLSRTDREGRPFTVVMAGSMADHKDFASLVRASSILNANAPGRFRFDLLGDGADRPALQRLAHELDCEDCVAFPGRTGSIIPWLLKSDTRILLSPMGEGMSNFLMECMAVGLPVVCTAGGGNPNWSVIPLMVSFSPMLIR